MPEYTVYWRATAHGVTTVEAESESAAMESLRLGEGDETMEIDDIYEISDFEVVEAEYFQV